MRKNGREALERLLKSARGMLEYLIDDALNSDAFHNGSIEEQQRSPAPRRPPDPLTRAEGESPT